MQQPQQPDDVHGLREAPQTPAAAGGSVDEIYQALKQGLGHEQVNEGNVQELIARARADGHQMLAATLQEWQAPC